jgi:hypothetical protein
MTTHPYESPMAGRSAEHARTVVDGLRIAEIPAGVTRVPVSDAAQRLDHVHPRTSVRPLPTLRTAGWTPAHSAAAKFLGECFATGAFLGLVSELTRPLWGQRHG